VIFESSPVIPAAFLLLKWKFELTHDIFMAFIKDKLTSLDNLNPAVSIVIDDEKAVCNAIDKTLNGVVRVSCWNHIINSAKLWVRRHGEKSNEIPVFTRILSSVNISEFLYKFENVRMNWSKGFVDYYEQTIHAEVCTHVVIRSVHWGWEIYQISGQLKACYDNYSEKVFCIEFIIYFDIVLTR